MENENENPRLVAQDVFAIFDMLIAHIEEQEPQDDEGEFGLGGDWWKTKEN